jgi:hypothetical protein
MEFLPDRRRSRTESCLVRCAQGSRVAGARCLRIHGFSSIPRSSRTSGSGRSLGRTRPVCRRRGSDALQRLPTTNQASSPEGFLRSARPSSIGRLIVVRGSIRHGRAPSSNRTRRAGRCHIKVPRNPCRRRAGAEALGRFAAWPVGAQLLGECPVVLIGSSFSSARCSREPPDLGASLLRSWRCRCVRRSMCRAQLRRRGDLFGAACRRGLGTACWLSRTVVMWRRLCSLRVGDRVLPLGASGLLVGGHVRVPPNRVRWVGTPDWVESSFGWVLPGCGIAVRPLPRLIHRRRFTVLCWSRDGTAPAALACG